MTVTLDTSDRRRVEGYVGAANGNDQPLSITVAEANSTLVVFVSMGQNPPPTLTFNGVNIPALDGNVTVPYGLSVFALANPAVGTHDVVLTRSAIEKDFLVDASVWKGTLQSPVATVVGNQTAFANSGDTLAVTIPTGGVAVSGFNCIDSSPPGGIDPSPVAPQILLGKQSALSDLATSYKNTAGNTTMAYTWAGGQQQGATRYSVILSPVAVADTTSPTLTSPTGASTGTTTASGTVTTDEANGTLYSLATTNPTETAATVKATGAQQTITTTGSKSVTASGLTASTVYYLHYVHRDAAGNDSAVANSASFTTATAGDTTAPVLSLPLGTQTGSTTASGGATTNEANGALYRYVSTNATETAATIKAANLTTAVTATGAVSVTFTGLTPSTTYYAHYVHRDAAGNDSNVVNSAAFTTAAPSTVTITSPAQGGKYAANGAYRASVACNATILNKTTHAVIERKTALTSPASGPLVLTSSLVSSGTEVLVLVKADADDKDLGAFFATAV